MSRTLWHHGLPTSFPGNSRRGRRPQGRLRRRFRPVLERMEERTTPSGAQYHHVVYFGGAGPFGSPGPVGLTPNQIRHAYRLDQVFFGGTAGDGTGQTVAIIDAFDDPRFVSSSAANFVNSDLHKFDMQFGLPEPAGFFTKVNQSGGTAYPSFDSGWSGEIALDVEWVHALAPGAKIVLIEANDNSYDSLLTGAVGFARTIPNVSAITMSFGGGEFPGETSFDSVFTTPNGHQGITFLASTGDSGAPGGYPAFSPNVVAVGGTTLNIDAWNNYVSESGWFGSGGGVSQMESRPSYQTDFGLSFVRRSIPDVAFDADPASGVAVYDTVNNPASAPWYQVGGTSFSSPAWAALIAIANQGRVLAGLGTLDGPTQTLPMLYSLPASALHDVTSGNNGFSAGAGYDLVTGRGSPIADQVVNGLGGGGTGAPEINVELLGANLVISNIASSINDGITLTINGANYEVSDPNHVLATSTGIQVDNHTVDIPIASVTGQIQVTTGAGSDTFTLNLSNGSLFPAGGIGFDGGAGTNTLALIGNSPFTTEASTATGAAAGNIVFDGSSTLTYAHTAAVDDATMIAGTATYQTAAAAEAISIMDGGLFDGFATTEIRGGMTPTFAAIFTANKPAVVVDTMAGADTVTLNNPNPAAGLTSLTIDGGAGGNTIKVLGTSVITTITSTTTVSPFPKDNVTVGNSTNGLQDILAALTITNPANLTNLTLNDTADMAGRQVMITNGSVTGLAPAAIFFNQDDLNSLTINGGSGGNGYNVASTPGNSSVAVSTTLNTGAGADAIMIDGSGLGSHGSVNIFNGQAGDDTFTVTAPMASGATFKIDGGAGTNTLKGPNQADAWNITAANGGNIAGVLTSFVNVQNLTGGVGNDTFTFSSGNIAGLVNGGNGVNTLSYAGRSTAIAVNLQTGAASATGGFANIQNLIGSSAIDTLLGANTNNTWNLNANNAGNVNGLFTFSSIESLTGGTGKDDFLFGNGVRMNGVLNGGLGSDSIDWSAYTTDRHVTLTVLGGLDGFNGTEASLGSNFANINCLIGGNGAGNGVTDGISPAGTFGFGHPDTYTNGGRTISLVNFMPVKAANVVTITQVGGTLTLTGDASSNFVLLDQPAAGQVRVRRAAIGTTFTSGGTSGQTAPLTFSGVTDVVINMGAGNAVFVFDVWAQSMTLTGNLTINGTTGNKLVSELAVAGNALTVGANLQFNTGSSNGNATLGFTNLSVTGNVSINHTGMGATNISFNALTTANTLGGSLTITLGTGLDILLLANTSVSGPTNIATGAGNAAGQSSSIDVENATFSDTFTLTGGDGIDNVTIQGQSGTTTLQGVVSVNLAGGGDTLNLALGSAVSFNTTATFDGDLGANTLNKNDSNITGGPTFVNFS